MSDSTPVRHIDININIENNLILIIYLLQKQTVQLCHLYTSLSRDDKKLFLTTLAQNYHVNHDEVTEVAKTMCEAQVIINFDIKTRRGDRGS